MKDPNQIHREAPFADFCNLLSKELADISISMMKSPKQILEEISDAVNCNILSKEFAIALDKRDNMADARQKFDYPLKKYLRCVEMPETHSNEEEECIYLCGNSLGLKPKATNNLVIEQLEKWGKMAVEMHFDDPLPAAMCDRYGRESLGKLVGADPSCVSLMSALTINLHVLLISFYQPTKDRYKILMESHAFPSDRYAIRSQVAIKGYDYKDAVIEITPRKGEHLLRTEDILKVLETEGSSIAVICLSGVQYFTGQKFDMEVITKAGHINGCIVGWDLAHAIGNVSIQMDKWGADFACWCTYKYLNSGPGCIAGAYVNKRHKTRNAPHLLGWWSNAEKTRFEMLDECDIATGVDSFRLSNPSPILVSCVLSSLELFDEYGMDNILAKQYLLTGYLELLFEKLILQSTEGTNIATIITPKDPFQRGCQLSVQFNRDIHTIHTEIKKNGVLCDVRLPSVLRIAPVPLYNSYHDVYQFVNILYQVICTHSMDGADSKANGQYE